MLNHRRAFSRNALFLIAAISATPLPLPAATDTWSGAGSSNWSDPLNWSGGNPIPKPNDQLLFNHSASPANDAALNDLAALSLQNISFAPAADPFTLSGNPITLATPLPLNTANLSADVGTINPSGISSASISNQSVSLPIALASGKHVFGTTAAGSLSLSGPITRTPGALLTFTPTASLNLQLAPSTTLANDPSGIIGGWALLGGNGPSDASNSNNFGDFAALDANRSVVPYTNYTIPTVSALTSNPTANVKFSPSTTSLVAGASSTDITELNTIIDSVDGTTALSINGTLKLGSANPGGASGGIYRTATGNATPTGSGLHNPGPILNFSGGTLVANGGGEITLAASINGTGPSGFAETNNSLFIRSPIADDGPDPTAINVIGYVVLQPQNGANITGNTFTGGLTITQGRVQDNTNPSALGVPGSNITVLPGGQAFLGINGTYNYNWTLSGIGTVENNGLGAIRAINNATIAGNITLASDAALTGNGAIVTANITGPGGLIIGHGFNTTSAQSSGTINFGDGTGAQSYSYQGDTIINESPAATFGTPNALSFTPGSNNILPHGPNRGNIILNAQSAFVSATLDLAGTSQTINGLFATATSPAGNFIQNSLANTTSTLAIGDNDTSSTFAGTIRNNANGTGGILAIAKIGAAALTLSGNNSYSGNTTVSAGTLIAANPNALGLGNLSIHAGARVLLLASLKLPSITFDGTLNNWGGSLDLAGNKLVVEPATDKATALSLAQNLVATQTISSSTLAPNFAIAVADNAALPTPFTTFGGHNTDSGSILLSPELLGDTNLDGKIDLSDLSTILNHFGKQSPNWTDGNFDNQPTINLTDLSYVLNNFGQTNPTASSSFQLPTTNFQLPVTPTPEPTSLLITIPALFLLRKRPRKS